MYGSLGPAEQSSTFLAGHSRWSCPQLHLTLFLFLVLLNFLSLFLKRSMLWRCHALPALASALFCCPGVLPLPYSCLVDVLLIFQGQIPCSCFSYRHRRLVVPFSGDLCCACYIGHCPASTGARRACDLLSHWPVITLDRNVPHSPLCSQGLKYSPPHAKG